ncbi:MAG: hypothetical protein AB8B50_15450 [Pirellulaceae bacterium]
MRSMQHKSTAVFNSHCLRRGAQHLLLSCFTLIAISNCEPQSLRAASPTASPQDTPATASPLSAEKKELYTKFEKLMTGAKLRGQFTVDGRPMGKLTEETYIIEKAVKQPEGDYWVITARIKYGKWDQVFPCPVEVKWAGSTPVITLDKMTIPGMGTFGARVVFHKDKYAGTWSHDEVGGHMFGKIEFEKSGSSEDPKNE